MFVFFFSFVLFSMVCCFDFLFCSLNLKKLSFFSFFSHQFLYQAQMIVNTLSKPLLTKTRVSQFSRSEMMNSSYVVNLDEQIGFIEMSLFSLFHVNLAFLLQTQMYIKDTSWWFISSVSNYANQFQIKFDCKIIVTQPNTHHLIRKNVHLKLWFHRVVLWINYIYNWYSYHFFTCVEIVDSYAGRSLHSQCKMNETMNESELIR